VVLSVRTTPLTWGSQASVTIRILNESSRARCPAVSDGMTVDCRKVAVR
jgi:hypothetical protein